MSNPNNYPGIEATIVGWASGPATPPAYDKAGTRGVLEISIPLNEGYKKDGEFVKTGTTWYQYVAGGDFAQNTLSRIQKGDKIRIDGAKQEVREYQARDGSTKLGITLSYGTFQVLESAAPASDYGDDTPY